MIFEWRAYQAADNAAPAIKDRFMKHTLRFFSKHGIGIVGVYSDPADPSKLYYLTQFETDAKRQAAWKAFQADPDWQTVKRESEVNGPLLAGQTTLVLHPEPTR
jgi:hypothetical protein